VYFDHRRRTDPGFRKALKRESRRQARIAKEEAEIQGKQQQEEIKRAVEETLEEGFPADLEEREAYFMSQISQGEGMISDGMKASRAWWLQPEANAMTMQVRTRSLRRYAFTKDSKSTLNRKLSSPSTTTLCQKTFSRYWPKWWHRTRVSTSPVLEGVVVMDLALRAVMALNKS
jgi:hypothetical protein